MKKLFLFGLMVLFVGLQSLLAQPGNDDLCTAILLNVGDDCSTTLPYDNTGANAQIGEPLPDCFTDGTIEASVWFYFAAPASGAVSITTDFTGSGMQDSQIALYELPTGDCSDLFTLNLIACNEDAAPFAVNTDYNAALPPIALNPGQFYFIQVDGYIDVYGYLSEGDFCIVVNEEIPPSNDDCTNSEVYGGFGTMCTKIVNGTTIGATTTNTIDVFTCDGSESNATVYYTFNSGVEEVEFNLLSGENINVSVLTNPNIATCDGSAVEVGFNCFTNINASAQTDPMDPDLLFTDLDPQTSYLLAIWTDEGEATDFSFCLTRAPEYACGDGVCYSLIESYANCPEECPCISSVDFYSFQTGLNTNTPEAVCPEIAGGFTDNENPGLYVPFIIETGDVDLSNSFVSSTVGTVFTSSIPPVPINQATNFLMYLFLTEAELTTAGNATISFTSDEGICAASNTFAIENLIRPQTAECGGCDLEFVIDYDNAFCAGASIISIGFEVLNATSQLVWLGLDGNSTFNEGVDLPLNLSGPNVINLFIGDVSLFVFDEGKPNCAQRITFLLDGYSCAPGVCTNYDNNIATVCRLQPEIAALPITCDNGTLNIPIDVGRTTGAVSFNPANIVTGTGTETDPHRLAIDLNNCQPINLSVSDESDCDVTPIVTINEPSSIAGGIFVSTNAPDWGVQIPYELGACGTNAAVTGMAAVLNDGDTAGGQLTDFCEPTPPELPATDVCSQIEGKIALIDRGQCNFTQKVENAQNCGAIGVVICNCQPGPGWCAASADVLTSMAAGDLESEITIPAVFMLYSDCQTIKAELSYGNEVEMCIGAPGNFEGCTRDFTIDVCDDYSIVACDDLDCNTENDVTTVDASGIEICACAGTPIQCAETETFNDMTCMCEGEGSTNIPQVGTFDCEE